MSYTQLRAFHAVASTGSFTKAAEALRVTQPTVSGQVKELEEMHGLALFDRHWRSIALTDAGRRLFELTRQMFAVEEAVQELLEQGRELRAGHLRVGADGPHHAVPLIAEFERRHGGLSVSLSIGNADQVLHDVLDYNVDVAVVAEVRRDERLYHFMLRRDPLVVFVPIDHPWAKLAEVELKDVATQRLVVREQGSVTRQIVEAGMAKQGIANGPKLEVQGREAMREFVAAGLGIGVVSAGEFSRDDRLVALPLKDRPLEMTEYVVCLEERRKVRIVRAFLEIARSLRTL